MRAAYYGGTALTGAGQNLGLFEYRAPTWPTSTTYYKNVAKPTCTPKLLSVDGTSTSCMFFENMTTCQNGTKPPLR